LKFFPQFVFTATESTKCFDTLRTNSTVGQTAFKTFLSQKKPHAPRTCHSNNSIITLHTEHAIQITLYSNSAPFKGQDLSTQSSSLFTLFKCFCNTLTKHKHCSHSVNASFSYPQADVSRSWQKVQQFSFSTASKPQKFKV